MNFLTAIAVTLVVILALCLWSCYNSNQPYRERAAKERQAEADKVVAEAKRVAQVLRDAEIAEGVEKALRVLFNEARVYDVRLEQQRREDRRYGRTVKGPVFGQETREVFHKVLRVGALEGRLVQIEKGNDERFVEHIKISRQVNSIQKALQPYA